MGWFRVPGQYVGALWRRLRARIPAMPGAGEQAANRSEGGDPGVVTGGSTMDDTLGRDGGDKPWLYVLHIGKTGGTAVKHALAGCAQTRDFRIRLCSHAETLRDVPVGSKVVFFVRDPLTRFVSGFYSRFRQGRPRYFYPWSEAEERAFREFATPGALAEALSSSDADTRERAVQAMRGIQHVSSSYWDWLEDETYFRQREADIFFVGFQEQLGRDFEELRDRLGLDSAVALPADEVQAHRNPRNLDYGLSETARENLKQWYARDYELLRICRAMRR